MLESIKDWFYLINILTNYLKQRSKNIHQKKEKNKMIKNKLKKNAKKIDKFLINYLNKQKKTLLINSMKSGINKITSLSPK